MFLDQNMVRVIHPETQNIYLIDSKEFSRELEQNGTILTEETIPCTAVQPQPVKHDMDSQSLKLPKIEIKKIFWSKVRYRKMSFFRNMFSIFDSLLANKGACHILK